MGLGLSGLRLSLGQRGGGGASGPTDLLADYGAWTQIGSTVSGFNNDVSATSALNNNRANAVVQEIGQQYTYLINVTSLSGGNIRAFDTAVVLRTITATGVYTGTYTASNIEFRITALADGVAFNATVSIYEGSVSF